VDHGLATALGTKPGCGQREACDVIGSDRGHRRTESDHRASTEITIEGDIRGGSLHEIIQFARASQRIAGQDFTCHAFHEQLLVFYASVVTVREVTTTHKGYSLIAVERYRSFLDLVVAVGECPRVIQLDSSERVSNVLETIEVCHRYVVDALVDDILDGLNHEWDAAVGHCSIDLGLAVPGNFDPGVTHDRHD